MKYPALNGIPVKIWQLCFAYDPETGTLTHRKDRPRATFRTDKGYKRWVSQFAGKVATSASGRDDYLQAAMTDPDTGRLVVVPAHRLAWVIQTGDDLPSTTRLRHINEDRADNRFSNLELSSHPIGRSAYADLVINAHA